MLCPEKIKLQKIGVNRNPPQRNHGTSLSSELDLEKRVPCRVVLFQASSADYLGWAGPLVAPPAPSESTEQLCTALTVTTWIYVPFGTQPAHCSTAVRLLRGINVTNCFVIHLPNLLGYLVNYLL